LGNKNRKALLHSLFRKEDINMNTKRMVMIGTIAAAITLGGSAIVVDKAGNRPSSQFHTFNTKTPSRAAVITAARKDDLIDALGAVSDEEIHDALYNGKALADIAAEHNKDVQAVIDLQYAEMAAQLDIRLANGSITSDQHQAYKAELAEIIIRSVYALA
jgi:hypothetical protein